MPTHLLLRQMPPLSTPPNTINMVSLNPNVHMVRNAMKYMPWKGYKAALDVFS